MYQIQLLLDLGSRADSLAVRRHKIFMYFMRRTAMRVRPTPRIAETEVI